MAASPDIRRMTGIVSVLAVGGYASRQRSYHDGMAHHTRLDRSRRSPCTNDTSFSAELRLFDSTASVVLSTRSKPHYEGTCHPSQTPDAYQVAINIRPQSVTLTVIEKSLYPGTPSFPVDSLWLHASAGEDSDQ